MKIETLRLVPFGCFDDLTLDFSGEGRAFHLVYGPNEAGKSTTLRAITGLLYGIPARSTDGFLFDNSELRIKATLRDRTGRLLNVVRRKGNKDTLLDEHGQPIAEEALAGYLCGRNQDVFTNMFGMNHGRLVEGGRSLLDARGNLGESLFQASAGVASLRGVLGDLDQQAAALFKPRGHIPAINQAKKKYDQIQASIAEYSVRSSDYQQLSDALIRSRASLNLKDADLRDLRQEEGRQERLRQALPLGATYKDLLSSLYDLGDVADLPPDARRTREKAESDRGTAQVLLDRLTEQAEGIRRRIDTLTIMPGLIDRASEIDDLQTRLGQMRKALDDLPDARRDWERLMTEARSLAREIGIVDDLDQVEALRLTVPEQARIQARVSEHAAVLQAVAALEMTTTAAAAEREALAQQKAMLPADPDTTALIVAHGLAARDAAIESQIEQHVQRVDVLAAKIAVALQQLPFWDGSAEAVERTAVPEDLTVDRFDDLFRRWQADGNALRNKITAWRSQLSGVESEILRLRLQGEVLTEGDLRAARQRREQGWSLVRAGWQAGQATTAMSPEFDPELPLADAFLQTIQAADHVADHLREDATRVAEFAARRRETAELQHLLQEAEKEEARLDKARAILDTEWNSHWPGLEAAVSPPAEMRPWLRRREILLNDLATHREQVSGLEALGSRRQKAVADLTAALALGNGPVPEGSSFASLFGQAQYRLEEHEAARKKREHLGDEMARLDAQLTRDHAALMAARERLGAWRSGWAEAIAKISRPDAGTEEVGAILSRYAALFQRLDDANQVRARITALERLVGGFEADARAAVSCVAPDLQNEPATVMVVELVVRLEKSKSVAHQRGLLHEQLEQIEQELVEASIRAQEADRILKTLMETAGCDNLTSLKDAEERSEIRQRLSAQIDQTKDLLKQFSADGAVGSVLEELGGVNADDVKARIHGLDDQIGRLSAEVPALNQEIGSLSQRLQAIDGGDAAAAAAEQAQQVLAELKSGAERYVRLRLAAALLRRQIERYRLKNQGPILERAGDVFRDLTLEAFSGLTTDYDDKDTPVLRGVRRDGAKVDVEGMSDGTRDLLYLSLRLGSIENQLASSDPIPLVVDDILINLDDERSKAVLRALYRLSKKTQVVVFTHHMHLRRLAEEVLPASGLTIHSLVP